MSAAFNLGTGRLAAQAAGQDGFDSPDGRTYSGPLAETPGKAAYIEYWTPTNAPEDREGLADCWARMAGWQRDKWERAVQAGIDATGGAR